jgi:hypothetical protein
MGNGEFEASIGEILRIRKYYNVAMILLAMEGEIEHLVHFLGEREAFTTMRRVMEYTNFIRNVDFSTYPIVINRQLHLSGYYNEFAAAIRCGKPNIYYFPIDCPCPEFGDEYLGEYPKAQRVRDYYVSLTERFNTLKSGEAD